jgi:hypothetical protein
MTLLPQSPNRGFRSSSLVSREALNGTRAVSHLCLRDARYASRDTGFLAISSLGCARDPELVEGVMNCHESYVLTVS